MYGRKDASRVGIPHVGVNNANVHVEIEINKNDIKASQKHVVF